MSVKLKGSIEDYKDNYVQRVVRQVECTFCGAVPGQRCVTTGGRSQSEPHQARVKRARADGLIPLKDARRPSSASSDSTWPAPNGDKAVYAVHGLWWEDDSIHVTMGGAHWNVKPGDPQYNVYALILQHHGRRPAREVIEP